MKPSDGGVVAICFGLLGLYVRVATPQDAGELPVGYVQLKPGAAVQPVELEAWVRERAAVPVQIIPIDPMPLTGVSKIFKPQFRWDAAGRIFTGVLAPPVERGADCNVQVGPNGSHGSIATVTIAHVPEHKREQGSRYLARHFS
jgi:fatty-acyl-CoA synthase